MIEFIYLNLNFGYLNENLVKDSRIINFYYIKLFDY